LLPATLIGGSVKPSPFSREIVNANQRVVEIDREHPELLLHLRSVPDGAAVTDEEMRELERADRIMRWINNVLIVSLVIVWGFVLGLAFLVVRGAA
jgi:hypothetical protein